jgi:nitroimidazol reductase NimA-like FMN-containing flavoprotein (pyridoxamine 5'-phosphate oxidase superfamily)
MTGMRRHDKEIKDESIIHRIFEHSAICRLGLAEDGEIYIVPVNYAWKDGLIYIHSAPEGRKMEILRRNKKVSFEIEYSEEIIKNEIPCEWSAKYRSLIGLGLITIENDPEEKKKGLEIIMMKYGLSGKPEFSDASVSGMVLLVMKVLSVTGKQSGDW